jgi:acetyl esterase/lipase
MMRVSIALLCLISSAGAALKPIDVDIQPLDNKAAVTYKATPQGDLRLASAEYRIERLHRTPLRACAEDAKSAIRWFRMNASRLGVDRTRVIAGGGSSGATIAAFAAYNSTFKPDGEDDSISCKPDALVLINPAFGFPDGGLTPEQAAAAKGPIGAFITSWKVTRSGPPAILFFGTEDPLQEKAREFARELMVNGTRAEFYTAQGQRHGFYNRSDNSLWHTLVLRQTDLFLITLGYLQGDPAVELPHDSTVVLDKVRL